MNQDVRTLTTQKLSLTIAGQAVLEEVSIKANPKEIVGLLGPNGAGKTTLFRLLMGLFPPDQGQIFLDNEDITTLPIHLRARRGLGYLPQEPSAWLGLSVEDNIRAALELQPFSRLSSRVSRRPRRDAHISERALAVKTALTQWGLWDRRRQKAGTLSGGERRRLEVARLLTLAPRLLLLDEPFKELDLGAIEILKKTLLRLSDEGVGVLLADHQLGHALALCHRAYLIIQGRVVDQGAPGAVIHSPFGLAAFPPGDGSPEQAQPQA